MRLIYITVSMPFGPHEAFFVAEAQELLRQGCELMIVQRSPCGDCTSRDAAGLDKVSQARALLSPSVLTTAVAVCAKHPLRALRALGCLFRSRSAITLAKNLLVFPKALWLADLARRWGADHIHAHWVSTTGTMAMVAGEISGIPWSCTAHRGDILENNLLEMKLRRASFVRFIAKDGIPMAEGVCGTPLPGNTLVLHLPVSLPVQAAVRDTMGSPATLMCPGYLIERKGQRYLIEAVHLLRQMGVTVRVLFAGDGEMRSELETLVAEQQLQQQVTFLGHVVHAELLDMLASGQVDAVVLPTLHEGIPVALIEPMAYGIPVISTNVGGVPELLEGEAGIMVPSKDPAALAEAIRRVVGDPALGRRIGQNGRRRVEDGWAAPRIVAQLLDRLGQPNAVCSQL